MCNNMVRSIRHCEMTRIKLPNSVYRIESVKLLCRITTAKEFLIKISI